MLCLNPITNTINTNTVVAGVDFIGVIDVIDVIDLIDLIDSVDLVDLIDLVINLIGLLCDSGTLWVVRPMPTCTCWRWRGSVIWKRCSPSTVSMKSGNGSPRSAIYPRMAPTTCPTCTIWVGCPL